MEAFEIIALVAVLVTGFGAAFTVGVNACLANRRMAHEESMQEERLAFEGVAQEKRLAHEAAIHDDRLRHERAEAVRITAATAYSDAVTAVSHVNQNTINVIANVEGSEHGGRVAVEEAMRGLGFVAALGWSEAVRDTAYALLDEIAKLANTAWAHAGAIRNGNETTAMMDRLEVRVDTAWKAIEAYRAAISE